MPERFPLVSWFRRHRARVALLFAASVAIAVAGCTESFEGGAACPTLCPGKAAAFKDTLARVAGKPKVLIIRMRAVPVMDSSGIHALLDVVRRSRKDGTLVLLSDVHSQPLAALSRSHAIDEIEEVHLFATLDAALVRARDHLGASARRAER